MSEVGKKGVPDAVGKEKEQEKGKGGADGTKFTGLTQQPGESTQNFRYRMGLCLRCGEKGHSRRDCKAKAAVPAIHMGKQGKLGEGMAVEKRPLAMEPPTVRFVPGEPGIEDASSADAAALRECLGDCFLAGATSRSKSCDLSGTCFASSARAC